MVQRIRLGELLVKAGILDDLKLRSALNEQRKWGGRLGKVIVDLGYVEEPVITKALSKQLGIPRAQLAGASLPQEVLRSIDASAARMNGYCPERYEPQRKVLTVAMADPTDVRSVDDLAFRTGCRVETTLAGEMEIAQAIERLFFGRNPPSVNLDGEPSSFAAMAGAEAGPFSEIDPVQLGGAPAAAPAERFGPLTAPPSSSSIAAPGPAPASTSSSTPEGLAAKLDAAQKRQNRAIRVMIDMLIERGIFTEDEFRARLGLGSKGRR